MMLDYEYALFTAEDPIKILIDASRKLPLHKRYKMAGHIRRASSLVKQCKKFRDIVIDEKNPNHMFIGLTFTSFFGTKLDRHRYMQVPRDIALDYVKYLTHSNVSKKVGVIDDKYMRAITKVIMDNSKGIDSFVKAFLSIRLAQDELDKLQSA